MQFEWDAAKASTNVLKHGVDFDEASTVFADGLAATGRDPDHSTSEARFLTFGLSRKGRVLAVHTQIAVACCESSALALRLERKNRPVKKTKLPGDEMRAEYRREDLGPLVRGKYAARYAKATNIVVIDPALTKAFPTSEAVNEALRGLLALTEQTARLTGRSKRVPRKRVTA